MSSPAKLMNSFHLFTSREIIKQQRRTNFAIRFFSWRESSIIIEISWWWLSVQPGEGGKDFQYPVRDIRQILDEGYPMHQASGPPGSERLWKNCLRKAGKLVERAKTMMTRASPDLIYRVSGSPHPSPQLTCWRQTAAGWRAGVVSQRGLTWILWCSEVWSEEVQPPHVCPGHQVLDYLPLTRHNSGNVGTLWKLARIHFNGVFIDERWCL